MTGLPPGRRVHQSSTPSGNLKSRTQSSVPSAESYGTLLAEASPLVSRETSPAPRNGCHAAHASQAAHVVSIGLPCFSNRRHSIIPPKADVSATYFRGSRTPYPVGHDVFNGRPLPGTGRRHHVAPHVLRHTPYLPPGRERASRLISSLRSQLLRSVTSAASHGALPSDASPLVSRETDSQTRRGRHGSADVSPRSALPGWVSTALLFAVSATHMTPVSSQEPRSCLSTAPRCRTPPLTPRLVRQQMRYRGREQHEESSLLECEPMPRPGKGLRRHHRPLICYMRTHHVD